MKKLILVIVFLSLTIYLYPQKAIDTLLFTQKNIFVRYMEAYDNGYNPFEPFFFDMGHNDDNHLIPFFFKIKVTDKSQIKKIEERFMEYTEGNNIQDVVIDHDYDYYFGEWLFYPYNILKKSNEVKNIILSDTLITIYGSTDTVITILKNRLPVIQTGKDEIAYYKYNANKMLEQIIIYKKDNLSKIKDKFTYKYKRINDTLQIRTYLNNTFQVYYIYRNNLLIEKGGSEPWARYQYNDKGKIEKVIVYRKNKYHFSHFYSYSGNKIYMSYSDYHGDIEISKYYYDEHNNIRLIVTKRYRNPDEIEVKVTKLNYYYFEE